MADASTTRSGAPRLLLRRAGAAETAYELAFGRPLLIGAAPDCDLRVEPPHDRVGRYHAAISWRGARVLVEDLGTPGGVWIGDQRLEAGQILEWNVRHSLGIGGTPDDPTTPLQVELNLSLPSPISVAMPRYQAIDAIDIDHVDIQVLNSGVDPYTCKMSLTIGEHPTQSIILAAIPPGQAQTHTLQLQQKLKLLSGAHDIVLTARILRADEHDDEGFTENRNVATWQVLPRRSGRLIPLATPEYQASRHIYRYALENNGNVSFELELTTGGELRSNQFRLTSSGALTIKPGCQETLTLAVQRPIFFPPWEAANYSFGLWAVYDSTTDDKTAMITVDGDFPRQVTPSRLWLLTPLILLFMALCIGGSWVGFRPIFPQPITLSVTQIPTLNNQDVRNTQTALATRTAQQTVTLSPTRTAVPTPNQAATAAAATNQAIQAAQTASAQAATAQAATTTSAPPGSGGAPTAAPPGGGGGGGGDGGGGGGGDGGGGGGGTAPTAAPGAGTPTATPTLGPPVLSELVPPSAVIGEPDLNIEVRGANFTPASQVRWQGRNIQTTFVSDSRLTALVPADLLTAPDEVEVRVSNGDVSVGPLLFRIRDGPLLSSISPNSARINAPALTMVLKGRNFNSRSVVRWNGVSLTPTVVSPTQLNVDVANTLLQTAGTVNVSVAVPGVQGDTPGVTTDPQVFTILPLPQITGFSPASTSVGSPGFVLTVNGSGFVTGTIVRWDDQPLTTVMVTPNQLTATVPDNLLKTIKTVAISVIVPDVVGPITPIPAQLFQILDVSTLIVSPDTVFAGGPDFSLTASLTNFTSGVSTIYWNGTAIGGLSSTSPISLTIPRSLIGTPGSARLTVVTSRSDGTFTSTPAFVTIRPAPVLTALLPNSTTLTSTVPLTLTLTGANLEPLPAPFDLFVDVGSETATILSRNDSQVIVQMPVAQLLSPRQVNVSLRYTVPGNPAPATLRTAALPFTVLSGPDLSTIAPTAVYTGVTTVPLTLNGSGFTATSEVRIVGNGQSLTLGPTFNSASRLTVDVPIAALGNVTTATTFQVSVVTRSADGSTIASGSRTLAIAPYPTISDIGAIGFGASTVVGGPGFELTITGTNFLTNATTVLFGSTPLPPSSVTPTRITVNIPAALLTGEGAVPVRVSASVPGGVIDTGSANFTIGPAPVLQGLNPSNVFVTSSPTNLTLSGVNFIPGRSRILWQLNGSETLTPATASVTQLSVTLNAPRLEQPGTARVAVVTDVPGGTVTTGSLPVTIGTGPTLASVSPNETVQNGFGFNLTLNGTGFGTNSVVRWQQGGTVTNLTPVVINSGLLVVRIDPPLLSASGVISVSVENQLAGVPSAQTAVQTFNVRVPPAIVFDSVNNTLAGAPDFVMRLNVNDFYLTSWVVEVEGTRLIPQITTTEPELRVIIPSYLVSQVGILNVRAIAPIPGGEYQTSPLIFTVNAPPSVVSYVPASMPVNPGGPQELFVTVSNFNTASDVVWSGITLPTSTTIPPIVAARVDVSLLQAPYQAIFLIRTPAPTGGFVDTPSYSVVVASGPRRIIEAMHQPEPRFFRRGVHDQPRR